jgi:hypothetical protein
MKCASKNLVNAYGRKEVVSLSAKPGCPDGYPSSRSLPEGAPSTGELNGSAKGIRKGAEL